MKQLLTTLLFSLFLVMTGMAQKGTVDEVISAMRAGNASQLAAYFDDNIELTMPDKSDNFSKAQAQLIIKDFFNNNDVKGFDLKHKGESPNGHFCIGTLQTNGGNFRTNVFLKTRGGKELIREIRFQAIE